MYIGRRCAWKRANRERCESRRERSENSTSKTELYTPCVHRKKKKKRFERSEPKSEPERGWGPAGAETKILASSP